MRCYPAGIGCRSSGHTLKLPGGRNGRFSPKPWTEGPSFVWSARTVVPPMVQPAPTYFPRYHPHPTFRNAYRYTSTTNIRGVWGVWGVGMGCLGCPWVSEAYFVRGAGPSKTEIRDGSGVWRSAQRLLRREEHLAMTTIRRSVTLRRTCTGLS